MDAITLKAKWLAGEITTREYQQIIGTHTIKESGEITANIPTLRVGGRYMINGRSVQITSLKGGKVYYQGKGIGGSSSVSYFKSQLEVPKEVMERATSPVVTVLPDDKTPAPVAVHKDTSLLKLTKEGSTKLYIGVGIVAIVIIFGGFKVFRKVIKL